MTLQEFSTSGPALTEIRFFVDEGNIIKGMNVSSTACNGINTYDALSAIRTITVNIEGVSYTFTITTRELKTGYYFFTVEDVYVPEIAFPVSDSNNSDCGFTTFLPSANDATFSTSEYNATIGNAIETRLNSYFYSVNRIRNQAVPANYLNIISGSADYAPIPDSNYSSIGFISGRHVGTKTTSKDFGIDPALIATMFEGAVYPLTKDDYIICSESVSNQPIKEYLFSPNLRYKVSSDLTTTSDQLVDALETPSIRKTLLQKGTSGLIFNSNSTTLNVDGNLDIKQGDHLVIVSSSLINEGVASKYEYLHVIGSSYNSSTNITSISIEHQACSKYGDTSSINITTTDTYAIYNLFGDAIYVPNGGQIYRVADKKVYIPSTDKIFITDERGRLICLSSTCSS